MLSSKSRWRIKSKIRTQLSRVECVCECWSELLTSSHKSVR